MTSVSFIQKFNSASYNESSIIYSKKESKKILLLFTLGKCLSDTPLCSWIDGWAEITINGILLSSV